MRGLRILVPAGLLSTFYFVIPATAPTSAEVVRLNSGEELLITQHRIEGDEFILELRTGGELRLDRGLIESIELDRTPRKTPELVIESQTPAINRATNRLSQLPYSNLIEQASKEFGVNIFLLHSVIEVESQYKANAMSPAGAMGLMQLMPSLVAQYSVDDPFNPFSNIQTGTLHLKKMIDKYGISGGLAAYNAGEGAVRRFKGIPPFPETHNYINRVMDLVDEHQTH